MRKQYKAVLVLGLAASLTGLAACGGGGPGPYGGGEESSTQFTKNASGAMTAWGFNNADDVGKARLDYAKSQLGGVNITLDQTGFDAQSSPPARLVAMCLTWFRWTGRTSERTRRRS
jgi:multiple sugar transport system substrate-binding protein